MAKELEIHYTSELDIFTADYSESKEYDRSFQVGDFIIDIGREGEVVGVEIQNISKILGVEKEKLESITAADLSTRIIGDGEISITLRLKVKDEKTTLATQIQQPETTA